MKDPSGAAGSSRCAIVQGMTVFDDLAAEQERLAGILGGLDEGQWTSGSGAAGWTIADVVLHLAQSEESVVATASGGDLRTGLGSAAGGTVDERVASLVAAERAAPDVVFERWQRARRATLATTRLAEHWAHGLDITGPLLLEFPDTDRLRHVAWLAHRTLPYAMTLAGEQPASVRCELTAPDGASVWEFGPVDAESGITGPAGDFCRVAARRLAPDSSRLSVSGPHGATALRLVRTYAE